MTGLYLHIPFCLSKCDYCDFFSLCGDDAALSAYVDLLRADLNLKRPDWNSPFETIFFGGGTPSRLTPQQLTDLLATIRDNYGIAAGAEISLEANPGTLDRAKLDGYRRAGINRISLGVQSLNDRALTTLGRRHSSAEARAAFFSARSAGFDNLSTDLIFGLPDQTEAELQDEIYALLELAPEHISTYGLTLEEGTPLHDRNQKQRLPLPDDEQNAAFYLLLHQCLTEAGYRHYEISNYALPGRECRHNQATWRRQSYLGVGAGAHSFIASGWGERRAVPPDLDLYSNRLAAGLDPSERIERFDHPEAMSESAYLALRTAEGIDAADFRERFGTPFDTAFSEAIERCGERLRHPPGRWHFTPQGWLLYDHLIQHFLL